MHKELKRAIMNWMIDNSAVFNRVNACVEEFRQYIYAPNGDYIIGGEEVGAFISSVDKLI